jgi:hypothetical protein
MVVLGVSELRPSSIRESDPDDRALAIWPGLDRKALARCHHDRHRIARLVARRTSMPLDSILALLSVTDIDREFWFG